jgi:hypothetical protein
MSTLSHRGPRLGFSSSAGKDLNSLSSSGIVQNGKSAKHPGIQRVIATGARRPTRQAQPQEPSPGRDQNVSLEQRILFFREQVNLCARSLWSAVASEARHRFGFVPDSFGCLSPSMG